MQPRKMKKDEIQSVVKTAVDDAVDFIRSEIAEDRIKAQRYFEGEVDIGHEDGRSKVVATKCRDVVRAIKPSLMRVFFQTDKPVEFVPRTQEDVAGAEQATAYAQWKFNAENGFRLLNDAIHDALVKKAGILKAYHEDYSDVEIDEYSGLTEEEFAFVQNDPEIEIIEAEYEEDIGPEGMPVTLYNAKVSRQKKGGKICLTSIPPEDFFVDANATCLEDAYVCGHSTQMRVGDLVEMGFEFSEVVNLDSGEDDITENEEEYARRDYADIDDDENALDPSMKKVLVTEAYMKMDVEGTGIPRMYRFILGGTKHKVLDKELCDDLPFAVFECDPEPHAFFGRSLVELLLQDQDAATSLLRGLLDNVALVNTPRTVVMDGTNGANMDDVLNNEIGGIIRTKNMDAVREIQVSPIGMSVLPALQHYNEEIENKTGVTRASVGLNPDALQSTTAAGVNATVQAASGQSEVIARNLAEGGMRQLFRLLLRLTRKHATQEEHMRLDGKFVPVDPRDWNAEMDCIVNVGLGTGQQEERIMAMQQVMQDQSMIWQAYGPGNGLVTMTQMRNTRADLLGLMGVKNADRYYMPMDPQTEQMLVQQAQEAQKAAAEQGNPLVQAEQIKAQAKMQGDMAKLQQEGQFKQAEMQMDYQKAMAEEMRKRMEAAGDDDLERDRLIQELFVEAAKIAGQYGAQVNTAAIQAEQQKDRNYGEQ